MTSCCEGILGTDDFLGLCRHAEPNFSSQIKSMTYGLGRLSERNAGILGFVNCGGDLGLSGCRHDDSDGYIQFR